MRAEIQDLDPAGETKAKRGKPLSRDSHSWDQNPGLPTPSTSLNFLLCNRKMTTSALLSSAAPRAIVTIEIWDWGFIHCISQKRDSDLLKITQRINMSWAGSPPRTVDLG